MKQDKLIWFAIVFSTFMYALVIWILYSKPEGSFEDGVRQQMTMVMYAAALIAFVFGLFVPGTMRGPARVKMIAGLAIFESCAIYGLVAAMLARDWRLFIPTWVVALLGMWRVYPSDSGAAVTPVETRARRGRK